MNEESRKPEPSGGQSQPPGNAQSPPPPVSPPPRASTTEGRPTENGGEGSHISSPQHDPPESPFWRATFPEWLMGIFTVGIFVATCVYARVANGQLTSMNRTLSDHEAEQRAFLILTESMRYAAGAAIVGIEIRNIGQTTAKQVRMAYNFTFYPYSPAQWKSTLLINRQNDDIAATLRNTPETFAFLPAGMSTTVSIGIKTTAQDYESATHIPGGWVVTAWTTYNDIYQKSHWTNYCRYETIGNTSVFCQTDNDQGDY